MLEGCGVRTGIDLGALCEVGDWISGVLGRPNSSRVGVARLAQQRALIEAQRAVDAASAAEAALSGDADAAGVKAAVSAAHAELAVRCIGVSWPQVLGQSSN